MRGERGKGGFFGTKIAHGLNTATDQGSEPTGHRSESQGKKRRLRAHLPHDHGVLVRALPPLLRVEASHGARAVAVHPPGDPRELVLRHLSPSSEQLLAAAGEGAAGGRALPAPAAPLPQRRPFAGGGGLGGEAGAHGGQWDGGNRVEHRVRVVTADCCMFLQTGVAVGTVPVAIGF